MTTTSKPDLLKRIPPMTELLKSDVVAAWLKEHPLPLVTACLRQTVGALRERVLMLAKARGPAQAPLNIVIMREFGRLNLVYG